jgi:hypothetical protein
MVKWCGRFLPLHIPSSEVPGRNRSQRRGTIKTSKVRTMMARSPLVSVRKSSKPNGDRASQPCNQHRYLQVLLRHSWSPNNSKAQVEGWHKAHAQCYWWSGSARMTNRHMDSRIDERLPQVPILWDGSFDATQGPAYDTSRHVTGRW